jgi:uncharacterized protein (TIGR02145 family)
MKKAVLLVLLITSGIFTSGLAQVTPGSIVVETIDPYLATPASNHVKTIPVVILRYLPTVDGINIDVAKAPDYWNLGEISLDQMKDNIDKYLVGLKFSLEEGSKFRGYENPGAVPYLGYQVIQYWTIYDQAPKSDTYQIGQAGGYPVYEADFIQIFEDFDLQAYVNNFGVKEIWIWFGPCAVPGWPSYDPEIHLPENFVDCVESNMSSPTTGDISNSHRFADDIPICDSTVVVYCYNIRRTQAEAVHNHGHQLESIYKYAAEQQDGNFNLFVHDFSGWGPNYSTPPLGRAGDCHHPPNTTQDYDYLNTTLVDSDIEDWRPSYGAIKPVNVNTWGSIDYPWPDGYSFPQLIESQWYIYWMQNMPGYNNQIPYNSEVMTNWWIFTSAWDSCADNNVGLHYAPQGYTPCNGLPSFSDIRDGKTYNTVEIGTQCWMKQNLNIGTRKNASQPQLNNGIIEKYCYSNQESNCTIYGGEYQWAEMVQYLNGATNTTSWDPEPTGPVQGICPAGWHIPSNDEWTEMTTFIGGLSVAGGKMKETGLAHWASPNTEASDASHFTALPAGFHFGPGTFYYLTTSALFWSSTEGSATQGWYRMLAHNNGYVSAYNDGGKADGFSVRCILDNYTPTSRTLQNIMVPFGQSSCYGATQFISTAGAGTTFSANTGSVVNLIAGQEILLNPGTMLHEGCEFTGTITTNGSYCGE